MDHQPSSSNPHFFHEVLASVQYTGHVVPNSTVVNKHQILTLLIDRQPRFEMYQYCNEANTRATIDSYILIV